MTLATEKAVLSYALGNTSKIQLLPAHNFRAKDGRPTAAKEWVINTTIAQNLINLINRQQDKLLIDYEHQTLYARENGQKAPAAGWISGLEWVEGVGLFGAGIEWTAKAKQHIKNNEYRYISPVFTCDKITGVITGIISASLVNIPAIDGMTPVQELQALKAGVLVDSLNAEELGVCEKMGLSIEDYKHVKQQEKAGLSVENNLGREVCEKLGINYADFVSNQHN